MVPACVATQKLRRARKLVFGAVSLYSSHHYILCRWLEESSVFARMWMLLLPCYPPSRWCVTFWPITLMATVWENLNSMAIEEGWLVRCNQ